MTYKKGNIPWIKGRHHSEETKRKISLAQQGRRHSEERKKIGKEKGVCLCVMQDDSKKILTANIAYYSLQKCKGMVKEILLSAGTVESLQEQRLNRGELIEKKPIYISKSNVKFKVAVRNIFQVIAEEGGTCNHKTGGFLSWDELKSLLEDKYYELYSVRTRNFKDNFSKPRLSGLVTKLRYVEIKRPYYPKLIGRNIGFLWSLKIKSLKD